MALSKSVNKKNEIAIYTAIFGAYDDLRDPPKEIKGCDFYCFTDNDNLKSDVWKVINVESEFDDKTRDARKIKCLAHKFLPGYQYTLWVDANIIFKEHDIRGLFDSFLKDNDIAIHLHQDRDCVYDELVACIARNIDNVSAMVSQIVGYIHDRYPDHNGLAETTVVFRRNTEESRKVNNDWWNEILSKSKRDQLSINYVLWKNGVKYYGINKSVRQGKYFSVRDHNKNSYVERSEVLKINKMQEELIRKDVIIQELKYGKFPGGLIILKIINIVKKIIWHTVGRFLFHLRNDGFTNTLKRVKNFLLYGKGVIDREK